MSDQLIVPDATPARAGASSTEKAGHAVLAAAARGDSAFTAGQRVWTLEHAQELLEHYVGHPDMSGATFDDKLALQLAGVSDGAIRLFAELYYLDLVPLMDYKGSTKRSCLTKVLALASHPVAVPEHLDVALDSGAFGGGVAFKTRRYWQLAYLVQFAIGLLGLAPHERESLLQDALRFRAALDDWTSVPAQSQRFALLYLAFPQFFLPIVKREHRDLIRKSFSHLLADPSGDPDDDLRRTYEVICQDAGHHVDLYQAPYREQWDPKATLSKSYLGDTDKWGQFLQWAARITSSIDLEAQERHYKLLMAAKLDTARTMLLDGVAGWDDRLKSALNSGNLLHPQFRVVLYNDLRDHPDGLRQVLADFWGPEPDPERLDQLRLDLRELNAQSGYTPGNCTALGSVLLMGRDVGQFPPYLPTPVAKACELTGHHNDVATPHTRYATLLELCAQMLERTAETDVELQDLLDAQGLIWSVVKGDPPDVWTDAERAAFLAWRGEGDSELDVSEVKKAWLVRGSSVNGRDLVPVWRDRSSVSLAATKLRAVDEGTSRAELKAIVEEDYSQASYAAKAEKVDEFHAFLTRMQVGDLIATTSQGRLYLGTITGDPTYVASDDGRSNLRRSVDWAADDGVDYADVPSEVGARLQVQHEVVEMTQQLDQLEAMLAEPGPGPVVKPEPVVELSLPDASDEFAAKLHIDRAWLQESIQLLRERKQLIYYGPPGTGKTYVALKLAEHLAGDNVRLVQFHPAYTYEDFFEGYRPVPTGGFALRPGPLRKIVDQAKDNPSTPYFLIIDEINRGNLAKIFGELYFLLEYRDREIDLLYATDDDVGFTLPKNVFLIGTMNTADRSIALVDSAMRRRFAFEALHPSTEPTAGLLRRWLIAEGRTVEAADLLDALNARIEDEDFKIGPSYFMKEGGQSATGLARTWRTAILPLLEEHHYGELSRDQIEQRYGLPVIRARAAALADAGTVAAAVLTKESDGIDAPDPD